MSSSRVGAALLGLYFAMLAISAAAQVTDFRVRDPSAGTVDAYIFPPPPNCPGTHDVKLNFITHTVSPRFGPIPWLTVPATATFDAGVDPSVDVQLDLASLSPGKYQGLVLVQCTTCSEETCSAQPHVEPVMLEIAAPATFGASSKDANFGGLVDGNPASIHDLIPRVVGEIKQSSFMELDAAGAVIETLESKYIDVDIFGPELSDVSFVPTRGTTTERGEMRTEVEPVDDESMDPGEARYVRSGFRYADEEIYVGIDLSLHGITEARKKPQDYYVFTYEGQMGVVSKADLVHNLVHEGFHAKLAGTFNCAKPSGGGGACLEEEQEGYRVGNAAARAMGLPEGVDIPGKGYNAGSNPAYKIQFPQLAPGSTDADPTRDTRSSSLLPSDSGTGAQGADAETGVCRAEGAEFRCEGPPNYALACDRSALGGHECTLAGTDLAPPCSFAAGSWVCAAEPAAVVKCNSINCRVEAAGATGACEQIGEDYVCADIPAFGLACTSPGNCGLTAPLVLPDDTCPDADCDGETAPDPTAPVDNARAYFYAATQLLDCSRAATSVLQPLNAPASVTNGQYGTPVTGIVTAGDNSGDVVGDILGAFAEEAGRATATLPFAFTLVPMGEDFGYGVWPGKEARFAGLGAAQGPMKGSMAVAPDSSGLFEHAGATYQLNGGRYDSIIFEEAAGSLPPALLPFVEQQFRIGGTDYTSLVFEEHYGNIVRSAIGTIGLPVPGDNPCRVVLLPNDPNYLRTGRHGGNSWGGKEDDQWAIKRVGFTADEDSAWNLVGDTVAPVVVAVIDTGLDWHHFDIGADSVWRNTDEVAGNRIDDDGNGYTDDVIGWNFIGRDNKPWDFDGHGTVVAGIIVAAHNEAGIAGINPGAQLMVLKAVNDFGTTRASFLAEAIAYAVDNGAQVINISVGGPRVSPAEQAALDYARQAGVLVVAASGNDGVELDDYGPGGSDGVLTVGATHLDDRGAAFSNHGDRVDIAAPGVHVLGLRARFTDANYRPGVEETADAYVPGTNFVGDDMRYIRVSGTSFSTPIVAGVASLVRARHPEFTASDVERILVQTAADVDRPGRDGYTGHGLIDARAALSAGPDFFITAEITGIEALPADQPAAIRVLGTIDASAFKRAWLQIGPGDEPGGWRYVGQKRKYPIRDGVLGTIPVSQFEGSDLWQIVVNVEHKNGVVRRGAYSVTFEQ